MKAWLWFLQFESIVQARLQVLGSVILIWLVNVDQDQLRAAIALIPGFDRWWPFIPLGISILAELMRRKDAPDIKEAIAEAKEK